MGQAKTRGSFEKRKAESIIRDSTSLGGGFGLPIANVDPDIFIHLFQIGTEAGLSVASGAAITNESVQEALLAAIKELAKMQIEGKEAYLARLSCLRAIFDSGRFGEYFKQTEDGHVLVEHILLKAMATSPCTTQWNEQKQSTLTQFDLLEMGKRIKNSGK